MAEPNHFEKVVKMNSFSPGSTELFPPVKFKHILKSSEMLAEEAAEFEDELLQSDLDFTKSSEPIFFKNPLHLQLDHMEAKNVEPPQSPAKPGRNMRAYEGSKKLDHSEVDKNKQKLLEDIKKQQQKQDLKVNTMQAATALVNDMLLNGFHITPPDETPRLTLDKASQRAISEDHLLGPIEEKKLVVAMYHELKRIQKTHTEIANTP
ncbi:uncharacterized protein LOC131954479 [Physella acuta]|uniref:uncharacterized protein LOC131954479 n=1 Tax=Physella acuta TaxID=109671 RepID=UPI0027DE2754|nr:uncharacterized protein LOC131954479 [Physella acuta]